MLSMNFVRENPDVIKADLKKRGQLDRIGWVDDVIGKDKLLRELRIQIEELRHQRNEASQKVNELKKKGEDYSRYVRQIKDIPDQIAKLEAEMGKLSGMVYYILMRLPNILHEAVPVGKDETENVEVRRWGEPRRLDFELLPHGTIAEELDIADFKRAVKVSGTGFVYIKGDLVLLDLAIMRFAIDFLIKRGFTPIEPPLLLGKKGYEGVTDLADFEQVMYKIENEDLYLIATSEHPVMAMHMNEVFEEAELPVRYVGVSACFRREIGSHGVDTRGLFRMHQFNKVEQVVFCKPQDSWKIHEEILKNSEDMYQALEIPYRVVAICTGDIGTVAARKFDIEAWFPREQAYKEVGSCSNCTAYQATRLNIKYETMDKSKEYVHSLNNTGIATSRCMRAILENYQNKDGSITIPKVLVPFMGGLERIAAKKH
ncbi:serine--tRNA ligase [Candidatus Woesearchaeota archaeon CG08_land_8_20_14_0_20_47_9]|nr:MAG: serine--tRNA ligase [Candidatus Woesearchaeota archaeon CG1_02_47_18]PIO04255.1 MAG: serine--tRNA ligase [Candidatus Woesearchaeota archaeon CG08_land_8_20_14_0_20_47_9]